MYLAAIDLSALPSLDSVILVVIGLALGLAATALGSKFPTLAGILSKLGIDLKNTGKAGLPDVLQTLPIFNAAGQPIGVVPAASISALAAAMPATGPMMMSSRSAAISHREAADSLYDTARFVRSTIAASPSTDATQDEKAMQACSTLSDFMNRANDLPVSP